MRIGVISDTHGMLRPSIRSRFNNVDRIVHCGDVGSPQIIDELAMLAPVSVAYGNTDGYDVRSRGSRVVRLDCAGRVTIALHGDQFGTPTPGELKDEFPDADIILFGHTHKPLIDQSNGTVLVMNPGAAGPVRCSCRPSVGIIDLDGDSLPVAKTVLLDALDAPS